MVRLTQRKTQSTAALREYSELRKLIRAQATLTLTSVSLQLRSL